MVTTLFILLGYTSFAFSSEVFCPVLSKTSQYLSTVTGDKCFTEKQKAGTLVHFTCPYGFQINGPIIVQCLASGKWSGDSPLCTDIDPPRFSQQSKCDNGIVLKQNTLPGKAYAIVKLEDIKVSDNTGVSPQVECLDHADVQCQYKFGQEYQFNIGHTDFRIKATDQAGLFRYCRFRVIVEDQEAPKLIQCPHNIVQEVDGSISDVAIYWDVPKYTDNSGKPVDMIPSIFPGSRFRVSTKHTVTYTARDPSYNVNDDCIFSVEIKPKPAGCLVPTPPDNGAIAYTDTFAVVLCRSGFGSGYQNTPFYVCHNKEWIEVASRSKLADLKCTAGQGSVVTPYHGDCNSLQGKQEIISKAKIYGLFQEDPKIVCGLKI